MARTLLMMLLAALLVVPAHLAQADPPRTNLIQAKPQYLEATHVPSANQAQAYPAAPTPAEPMYVFWILGKLISYPIDTVESYVTKIREDWKAKPVPASATTGPNPFETRRLGQIPPAPPIERGAGSR